MDPTYNAPKSKGKMFLEEVTSNTIIYERVQLRDSVAHSLNTV